MASFQWPPSGGSGGSGTVTSVGFTEGSTSPIFTITGSPVTGSGTITETLRTQSANTVFSGPSSGSAAQPTFRALVSADISSLFGTLSDTGTDGIVVTGGLGSVLGAGTSIAQHVSDASHNGYLSSTDWSTFNGKQASGSYITALTGDVTASGPGSATASLVATTNSTLLTLSALTSASNLATIGTITSGTWAGTLIAINHGGTGVTSVTTAPTASSFAGWDANSNLSANSFIPNYATTVTAAGTTTLSVTSAQYQYFTGSSTQTVVLPVSATLVLGQSFTIVNLSTNTVTVESSGANVITTIATVSKQATFTCILASGTTAASWSFCMVPVGVANTLPVNYGGTGSQTVISVPAGTTWAGWDANKNLSANAFIPGFTTTATAAGTTTMTIASTEIQYFTGSSTQTVKLPTTSVVAGALYTIVNLSTGAVTVQSSGANTITTMAGSTQAVFTALVATPTTAANWSSTYQAIATTPVSLGGTGSTSATQWGVTYASTATTLVSTAQGAVNTVLTGNGAGAPTFSNPATGSYASAFHANGMIWSNSSATFADATSTGTTPALTIRKSSGITLTQAASSLPGVTFTPANNTAVYMVTASTTISGTTQGGNYSIRLYDGTTEIASRDMEQPVAVGGAFPVTLSSVYAPASAGAVTVKLQLAGSGATACTISAEAAVASAIDWSVLRIF